MGVIDPDKTYQDNNEKHMGIFIDQIIFCPGQDLTDEDVEKFAIDFIAFIESMGWATGGSFKLIDINANEKEK